MSAFGAETTAGEVAAGIDLTGRSALVTGGSSGLGAETARVLASCGAAVTLTARDVPKGEGVAAAIRESTGNSAVDVGQLELGSLESIRGFAKSWLGDHERLDLLVNNAGVMACPLARTTDGFEMQFGTNHLGHFLLTGLLVPALRAGAPARVVNLSSAGHRLSPVLFDDPNFERSDYDKWAAYGQAKSANILHALELDRRLSGAGIRGYAVHPGMIMTELGRHLDENDLKQLMANRPAASPPVFKPIPAGAATTILAATSPDLEGRGGLYLEDCHVAGPNASPDSIEGYQAWAMDPEAAGRLWALSEELIGERFDF